MFLIADKDLANGPLAGWLVLVALGVAAFLYIKNYLL